MVVESTPMETRRLDPSEILVGMLVWVAVGPQLYQAEVVEDRGNVGVGGRRIVRVRMGSPDDGVSEFEVPAEALVVPIPTTAPTKRTPKRRTPA